MAVVSALWGTPEMNALLPEEAVKTRERLEQMEGSPRLLLHGVVWGKAQSPSQNAEHMRRLVEEFKVQAFKLYPVWSPDGEGYRMDDPATGLRLLQQGLDAGLSLFAIHKGLPVSERAFVSPIDIGPAARAVPRARLLIYHSGYDPSRTEGPYDPTASTGVDALIRSLKENGIGKDGNVYAELGSIWREVMKDPEQAAHVLGKLLAHLGPERILWGTDAIWYGSPQDQIQAFRTFQISPEFQERFGYPALTDETRRRIFGLNAAQVYGVDVAQIRRAQAFDPVARAREEYRNAPDPSFVSHGPRTLEEFAAVQRAEAHR
jgi:predicted TIM-barrel fold metal-dependent hydrolase